MSGLNISYIFLKVNQILNVLKFQCIKIILNGSLRMLEVN